MTAGASVSAINRKIVKDLKREHIYNMTNKELARRKQDRLIRYLCDFMVKSYIKDDEGRFGLAEKAKGVRSKKVIRALKALYGRTKFGAWVREPLESNAITRRLEQMMKERDRVCAETKTTTNLVVISDMHIGIGKNKMAAIAKNIKSYLAKSGGTGAFELAGIPEEYLDNGNLDNGNEERTIRS
jgi:hypothetical protein